MRRPELGLARLGRKVHVAEGEVVVMHCYVWDCGWKLGHVAIDRLARVAPAFLVPAGYRTAGTDDEVVRLVAQPTLRLKRMLRLNRGPDSRARERREQRPPPGPEYERTLTENPGIGGFWEQFFYLPVAIQCPRCGRVQLVADDRSAL